MRSKIFATALVLALALISSSARAEWVVYHHDPDALISTNALCLVAPKTGTNRLVIKRIRLTRSGSTDVSHQFFSKVSDDSAGRTYNLSSCALPGCRAVTSVEGVREGQSYDLTGLNLVLPPGARFYMYGDTAPASTVVTVEVFYDEIR